MLYHAQSYISENSGFLNKLYGKCIAIRLVKKKKNVTVKQSHNPIITCSQKKIQADKVKYSLKIIRHQKVSKKSL